MSLKTIMIALLSESDSTQPLFLRTALDIAENNRAHVAVVVGAHQVKLGFPIPYAPVMGHLTEENERRLKAAQGLASAVVEAGKSRSIAISAHTINGAFNDMIENFSLQARVNDLVIAAAGGNDEMFRGSLATALLFETGRPVLFMPASHTTPFDLGTVVIAWDGSQRVARAVGDAMPFIETAKRVSIVCITDDKDLSHSVAAGDLVERLAHHNGNVTVTELPLADSNAGDAIIKHVLAMKANLLIMGAYAHSRWRELVLGGVTQTILRSTPVPTLMAH